MRQQRETFPCRQPVRITKPHSSREASAVAIRITYLTRTFETLQTLTSLARRSRYNQNTQANSRIQRSASNWTLAGNRETPHGTRSVQAHALVPRFIPLQRVRQSRQSSWDNSKKEHTSAAADPADASKLQYTVTTLFIESLDEHTSTFEL